ncbi:hypothetical protein CBE01nite_20210 [Clostridium beijerinckii]|uniref:Uncharacterized protein n=1 Tax=Clostridium beijerinckii TaxID=1520 RepID=A0A1S8NU65_CLOBE|nr:hypothetical protein [Clostridium beijerinckii]NRT87819.1 hypothetical protein [Clostridium beijerinckii]NRY63345.1 hypothetical protein [Clostridium beijerinckii]NRZ26853.1 hypothetical protein [Clostridium beijerinckii]NYB97351.1 hypothetical protein [Clostridium beijerinckii]
MNKINKNPNEKKKYLQNVLLKLTKYNINYRIKRAIKMLIVYYPIQLELDNIFNKDLKNNL